MNLKAKENRLNIEIEYKKQAIKNFEGTQFTLGAVTYKNTPGSTGISNPTETFAMKNLELYHAYIRRKERAEKELTECCNKIDAIENYIDNILDDELKEIFKHRFYLRESYVYIGKQYHLSRNVVSEKIKKYIKKCNSDISDTLH